MSPARMKRLGSFTRWIPVVTAVVCALRVALSLWSQPAWLRLELVDVGVRSEAREIRSVIVQTCGLREFRELGIELAGGGGAVVGPNRAVRLPLLSRVTFMVSVPCGGEADFTLWGDTGEETVRRSLRVRTPRRP